MNLARSALKEKGYYFTGDGHCRFCRRGIEWWVTPNDKTQPRDRVTLTPHAATCPAGKQRAKQQAPPKPQLKLPTAQPRRTRADDAFLREIGVDPS